MKILVFDIGGTSIKHSVCTENELGEVHETPTNARLGGRHIMNTIIDLIKEESGYDAIGISTAGQVNSKEGSIIYANSNIPDYTGIQIRSELEALFHVPVTVENDVNSAAMGEAIYGAGKDYDDFLCLTYGTGVGGAIVSHKEIYHGSSFSAGEFGGIITHGSERKDSSDYFAGCYERYASTTALVKMAASYQPSLTSGRKIFENLEDPQVLAILDRWIDEINLGLTTLTHIFNPSCIILGGGIMVQPYILNKLNEKFYKSIMPSFAHVKIKTAALGNCAGLLGANYLAQRYAESFR